MGRSPMPLYVGDVSALARSLRRNLLDAERIPSHVEMLNLLAKAGGFRNFQHFRAERQCPGIRAAEQTVKIDLKRAKKAAGYFDLDGRLGRWPKKHSLRVLCLWVLWSRLPAREDMSELELDERLVLEHAFCDHAMLRRWLVDLGFVSRTPDGREYRRVEGQPPAEALEVLRLLR